MRTLASTLLVIAIFSGGHATAHEGFNLSSVAAGLASGLFVLVVMRAD